jgi:drug/metabolite transporter (DMT)-like permease
MFSVLLAIIASTSLNLLMGVVSSKYTYDVSFVLLMVETWKLLICSIGMRVISNESHFQIRWGFAVNALLYVIVNALTHHIAILVPSALYNVLIQHKLLWVVLFSILLLKRRFSKQQYLSLVLILSGCVLLKLTDTTAAISDIGLVLIVLQGICSSLSSVWIEKMMKNQERPHISDDEKKQKLYWFWNDSFQMYAFGIPIYLMGNYTTTVSAVNIPIHLSFAMIALSVTNGLALGAVFVYHSSVVRSMVSAVVILLLAFERGVYTQDIVVGIALVLLGVVVWTSHFHLRT